MATIQGIYVALFGRPADPAGLAFFNEATNNGADLTAIGDLASTTEYQSRFTGMTNEQIINSIYQSLFERDGEAEGVDFYVGELEAGRLNINNIAIAILDGAKNEDLDTVNAKIAAANIFTSHLDLDIEIEAYRGDEAAEIGRGFLDAVTKDDPGTETEADAAILQLFTDQGQQPGGGSGSGGSNPDTVVPIGTVNPSSAGDHTFKAGEKITFSVDFLENVIVPATLQLSLSNGGTANYEGGSGTQHVTFSYVVPASENATDVEIQGIVVGSGEIKDAAGNVGSITPTTDLDIVIDTIAPEGAVAASGDGSFSSGETIVFTVTFAESVDAGADAKLLLTGGREAELTGGTGTNTLEFSYTVGAESASDLEVAGYSGTIEDNAGNAATIAPTTGLDIVVIPPADEVHVFNATGTLVAIYSAKANPNDNPLWHQNANPINAAVDAASANYTIVVGSGSYHTAGAPIVIDQDGLRLLGAQMDIDPRQAAHLRTQGGGEESIVNADGATGFIKIQANNVEINGFELTGATGDKADMIITDGDTSNSGAQIRFNIVHNANDDGIVIQNHEGAVVEFNRIYDTQDGVTVSDGANDTSISNNEMHNGKGDGHGGVYAYYSTNTTIEGNYIHDYVRSGIMLGERKGADNNVGDGGTITGNTIERVGHTGISVFQSDVTVSGNTVSGAKLYGISVGENGYEPAASKEVNNVDIVGNVVFDNNNSKFTGPFNVKSNSTDIFFDENQISGGTGPDNLNGTTGADIFVVRNLVDGTDTISGFARGSDKLDLRAIGFDFGAADSNNDNVIGAGDTNVSVSGGTITWLLSPDATLVLTGVAELANDDFV